MRLEAVFCVAQGDDPMVLIALFCIAFFGVFGFIKVLQELQGSNRRTGANNERQRENVGGNDKPGR